MTRESAQGGTETFSQPSGEKKRGSTVTSEVRPVKRSNREERVGPHRFLEQLGSKTTV